MTRARVGLALLSTIMFITGVAAAGPQSGLQLTISAGRDPRRVSYTDPKSHFLVLVQNRSGHDQRIWEGSNSWGYFNLSFELSDSTGKKWMIKKRDTIFTVNLPNFMTLMPGQIYVFDVYFGNEREWQALPLRHDEEQTVQIRAIYDVPETPESRTNDVWTGHLESPAINVTFLK